jgi:hypothetical protein
MSRTAFHFGRAAKIPFTRTTKKGENTNYNEQQQQQLVEQHQAHRSVKALGHMPGCPGPRPKHTLLQQLWLQEEDFITSTSM